MLKLGLETESLHLWLQHKRMDIFGFIEKAHELGLDGVQINVIKDYGLDEKWGALESASDEHLNKIKELLRKYGMYIELDMRNLDYDRLVEVLEVANIHQEWFKFPSTYRVEIYDDALSDLVISLVFAIDYVKEKESGAANSASS